MSILRVLKALLFLTAVCISWTAAQQTVALTPDQAVALALQNHPSLQEAEANVRSADAGATLARSALYPLISANASVTRNGGAFVFNPTSPIVNQQYYSYATGFQANMTVFDFGKTYNRISANNRLADATDYDYTSTRESVIMNALTAYYTLVQAGQVTRANEEAVDQTSKHLAEAKAFYSVGTRAQIDVTKAEVDYANANVNLITARNQKRIALLQLQNAMGVPATTAYTVQDTFEVTPWQLPLDSVRAIAFDKRPEYLAAQSRYEASKSLLSAAWEQHLPTISATGAYTWTNFQLSPLFSRWNAGLTVSLPIFQGFALTAQVNQAEAGVDEARAGLDLLVQAVDLDVEQNYLSLREAQDRIGATSKLVEQAQENQVLAERQFAAGVGTSLEVADAQLTLTNARITRIQALYDFNTALVRLKRSMGVLGE